MDENFKFIWYEVWEEVRDMMLLKDRVLFFRKYKCIFMIIFNLNKSKLYCVIWEEIIVVMENIDIDVEIVIFCVFNKYK